jgi:hypothetical protein
VDASARDGKHGGSSLLFGWFDSPQNRPEQKVRHFLGNFRKYPAHGLRLWFSAKHRTTAVGHPKAAVKNLVLTRTALST